MSATTRSVLFSFLVVVFVACSGENTDSPIPPGEMSEMMTGSESDMPMNADDHQLHANMQPGADEPTEGSIYNVDSIWRTRHGHEFRLDSLRGKVQVVAMVYTHCEYACPRILADMKRIRKNLPAGIEDDVNFVFISIDPDRDTPERFREFAEENDLDDEHWTLLNGSQGDILEIAALLGVRYRRISDTDFTHSNMITVLDREGEVVFQQTQLADSPTPVLDAIERSM